MWCSRSVISHNCKLWGKKPVPCSDLKAPENINPYCFKEKKKNYFQGICCHFFLWTFKYVENPYILLFSDITGRWIFPLYIPFPQSYIISWYDMVYNSGLSGILFIWLQFVKTNSHVKAWALESKIK